MHTYCEHQPAFTIINILILYILLINKVLYKWPHSYIKD